MDNFDGEVIAPASGTLSKYIFGEGEGEHGYKLVLHEKQYLNGIEYAFDFIGTTNFDIEKVDFIFLDFGHINAIEGKVDQGQSIGDAFSVNPSGRREQFMIAYWVGVMYEGKEYSFSPTLFLEAPNSWPFVDGITLPNECKPIPNNYTEKCK